MGNLHHKPLDSLLLVLSAAFVVPVVAELRVNVANRSNDCDALLDSCKVFLYKSLNFVPRVRFMQHVICDYVLVDNEKYKTALEPELRFCKNLSL